MKKVFIIMLMVASVAMAQTQQDSIEVKNAEAKLQQIVDQIVDLQSALYEKEKQLKDLYTQYAYIVDVLKLKKELIEEKQKVK